MATWQDRAARVLTLFEGAGDDGGARTWQLMHHVLDESNRDDYISKDFYNVQQTAGGLPPELSFDGFIAVVSGHLRDDLLSGSFDEGLEDFEIKQAGLTFDESIRRHIRFLNGIVHQAAAGEVHRGLWNWILVARDDDRSVYACYRDYLINA